MLACLELEEQHRALMLAWTDNFFLGLKLQQSVQTLSLFANSSRWGVTKSPKWSKWCPRCLWCSPSWPMERWRFGPTRGSPKGNWNLKRLMRCKKDWIRSSASLQLVSRWKSSSAPCAPSSGRRGTWWWLRGATPFCGTTPSCIFHSTSALRPWRFVAIWWRPWVCIVKRQPK